VRGSTIRTRTLPVVFASSDSPGTRYYRGALVAVSSSISAGKSKTPRDCRENSVEAPAVPRRISVVGPQHEFITRRSPV
jgi:hypothetical protein